MAKSLKSATTSPGMPAATAPPRPAVAWRPDTCRSGRQGVGGTPQEEEVDGGQEQVGRRCRTGASPISPRMSGSSAMPRQITS